MIRTGVRKDGRLSVLMKVAVRNIADDDLRAIVSYLRTTAPADNVVQESSPSILGKFVFGGMEPDASDDSLKTAPTGVTIERGRYLADLAMCIGCHSEFDMASFSVKGAPYSGGDAQPDEKNDTMVWVAPNLTPDPGV